MSTNFGLDELSSILEMLRENDITEFKLERQGEKLWLKRGSLEAPQIVTVSAVPQPQVAAIANDDGSQTITAAAPAPASVTPVAAPSRNLHEVKSPMVGTFYRRPAVDASPYVEVGDVVKKGQVLCIVEAMKLMNEIESDAAGRIVEVCLEDGKMAEYGEVLFRVEPV